MDAEKKKKPIDVDMEDEKTTSMLPTLASGLDSNLVCSRLVDRTMPRVVERIVPMHEVVPRKNRPSGGLLQPEDFPVKDNKVAKSISNMGNEMTQQVDYNTMLLFNKNIEVVAKAKN